MQRNIAILPALGKLAIFIRMADCNYKKNMDKPVRLQLVHAYHEYYRLEFCTTNRRWFNVWHVVEEYEPGTVGSPFLRGKWSDRWFKVPTLKHGEELIAKLRDKLKTVGDIYRTYIEPGERAEADYQKKCEEYEARINSVPPVIM